MASRAPVRSRKRKILRFLAWLGAVVVLLLLAAFYLLYAPAPAEPELRARPQTASLRVGAAAPARLC